MTFPSLAHIAIVVPDLDAAADKYCLHFGAKTSDIIELPDHGVKMIKVEMPGVLIELLHPLGENSPVAKFLEKNPRGGFHHMCLRVDDVNDYAGRFKRREMKVLNDGIARIGMEGEPVIFLHPHEMDGVMVELEQAKKKP